MLLTEPVQLALVVAVPTFVAPIVLLVANRWLDRGDKKRQYEREDEVKRQVELVAQKAAERDRSATQDAAEIKLQVKAVHTLVNSDKTALIEFNLASLQGQLAALMRLEVLGRKLVPSLEPTPEEVAAANNLRDKIQELKVTLQGRYEQTELAKLQVEQGHATIAADNRQAAATEKVASETKRIADVAEGKPNEPKPAK